MIIYHTRKEKEKQYRVCIFIYKLAHSDCLSADLVTDSILMQVFSVPVEEQRLKEMSEQQFGERGRVQTRICLDIMARTGTSTSD